LPRSHDVDIPATDLVGINGNTRVLLVYTCQQGVYPRGHVLLLRLPNSLIVMFRVVFWVILPCKMIVDRRFRGAYCLHHQGWWRQSSHCYLVQNLSSHLYFQTKTSHNRINILFLFYGLSVWIKHTTENTA
jgi:hypothetical protein